MLYYPHGKRFPDLERVESARLFHKFFPVMERLETELRKYRSELATLMKENAALEQRLDDAKPSIAKQLATGKQKKTQFLRRFCAAIPKEYKAAYHVTQQKKPLDKERQRRIDRIQ